MGSTIYEQFTPKRTRLEIVLKKFNKLLTLSADFLMHQELLDRLYLYSSDIKSQSLYIFLSTLFNCIWEIDNSSVFVGISAVSRCELIILEII